VQDDLSVYMNDKASDSIQATQGGIKRRNLIMTAHTAESRLCKTRAEAYMEISLAFYALESMCTSAHSSGSASNCVRSASTHVHVSAHNKCGFVDPES